MSTYRPENEEHAVCLFRNLRSSYWGVILERVSPAENDFLCVGTFEVSEARGSSNHDTMPTLETVKTNWKVL